MFGEPQEGRVMDSYKIAKQAVDAYIRYDRMWGSPIGLCLVEAFYSEPPDVTASMIAERLGMSDDTARRRLDALVNIGRALVVDCPLRGVCYQANAKYAEETINILRSITGA